MATEAGEGDSDQLSPRQIVRLAAAIPANNMAAIAEGYMDIDDAIIKNLQYENKDDAQAFNRDIIKCWAFKTRDNQVQVIKHSAMTRLAGGEGWVYRLVVMPSFNQSAQSLTIAQSSLTSQL